MAWQIERGEPENILRLTAEGPITTESVLLQAKEGIEIIVQEGISGAMVDYSNVLLEMPVADIFQLPDLFDALLLPRTTKIAIVLPADPVNMHKYTFFDDVANNRGYQVKLYWEPSEALKWLAKPSEAQPASPPL
jgi:hypothetical protein